MKLKRILLAAVSTAVILLTSCSDKQPEQKHLEYENAVSTFVGAFNKGDEQSFLNCFSPAVKEEFLLTEESAISMLDENIRSVCGEYIALSYALNDKTELSEEEIESIRNEYNALYGKRLDIKKAYSLDITFRVSGIAKNTEADMTIITAKTDSGWCICGEVITQIY